MILVDAGPLIALLDRSDPDHELCRNALSTLSGPLLTTWPALTEAMHFLGKTYGWHGQRALWALHHQEKLRAVDITVAMATRMTALMEKYQSVPMDLADASLVALAEENDTNRIFTLDGDFEIYRFKGKRPFVLTPS